MVHLKISHPKKFRFTPQRAYKSYVQNKLFIKLVKTAVNNSTFSVN